MSEQARERLLNEAARVVRAARTLGRARFARIGLNDQRAALVIYLWREAPRTLHEIAETLELQRSAAAALLARMTDDGLVEARRTHRGEHAMSLSAAGLALVQPIRDEVLGIRARAIEGLGEDEMEIANGVLLHVIENLRNVLAA